MKIEPYLFFNGRCEEALDFYQRALGARVEMMMRFRERPEPPPPGRIPEGWADKILHASLWIGGARVMVSDGAGAGGPVFQGFSLSIQAASEEEARRFFASLSDGGAVGMPLGPTFWSPCFGMVTDRFGVLWMVTVTDASGPERGG